MSDPLELYSAYLDGHCLNDAEVKLLRSWIADDERNVVLFVEFALLHAEITDRLLLGRLLEDLTAHRGDATLAPAMLAEAFREIEINSPRVMLPHAPPKSQSEKFPLSSFLASVAAGLLVCLGAWALWQGGAAAPQIAAANRDSGRGVVKPEPPKVAARLSASFDAEWGDNRGREIGGKLLEGAPLELRSGVVQLDMENGAVVVIEAPSHFVLTGSEALRLNHGKAAVRVDQEGRSFVVDTPLLQVVDLGTEFGVETASSGVGRVMVFDGSVSLAEASGGSRRTTGRDIDEQRRLDAGFEVAVDGDDGEVVSAGPVQPVANFRHFLRPDEIALRLGSLADRKLAAHYERQRIGGLLAFQGFDANSAGTEHTLGLGSGGLLARTSMQFVDAAVGAAGGIDVQGGPVFMILDTSPDGPFARAGLLTSAGRIGRSGSELWLTWRTQRMASDAQQEGAAGMSLMFGERSNDDEPMFFGRASGAGAETLCLQSVWGKARFSAGEGLTVDIDFDMHAHAVQSREVDDKEHIWMARVEFANESDRVSVWVDQDLSSLNARAPQAALDVGEVEFDRIRWAVNRGGEVWRFRDFAAATNLRALEQLAHVGAFHADK